MFDTKRRAMKLRPRICVFKKVRLAPSRWQFVALPRKGNSWIWDPRPGTYSIEWWEGPQRRRQSVGTTPAEALNAVRQKQWELAGQAVLGSPAFEEPEPGAAPEPIRGGAIRSPLDAREAARSAPGAWSWPNAAQGVPGVARSDRVLIGTPLRDAVAEFLEHIRVHSPEKPATLARYRCAMEHFLRLLGRRRYVAAVTRADIGHYKWARVGEPAGQKRKWRTVRPCTLNFEVDKVRYQTRLDGGFPRHGPSWRHRTN